MTGSPGEGTPHHGRTPRTHRPQAGTAIRWPQATPPRIPSRGRRKTRRGGIPHVQRGHHDPDPLPGRPKRGHRQRARPRARPGRSDSQAVNTRLSDHVSEEVASAFIPAGSGGSDGQVNKIVGLVRLFYYLALQERVGGTLLLHESRAFFGRPGAHSRAAPPQYSMLASQIFGVFNDQVQGSYLERRKRWLGSESADVNVSFPLLAGFVQSESESKGWSIGRTISWLRDQHEVHLFRRGLRDLLKHLEAHNNLAVNAILEELDRACVQWCEKLDTPVRPTWKFSLQVALPFLSPATDIAVPMPARTPAQKMLVLIGWVLRESIGNAPRSG